MALLTVADLLDDVLDEIPGKEQQPLIRAVNKVIRRLHTEIVQPERSTFTTKAKTTTGTVSVTQDSTAVTFSSGVLSASDPLRLVQIEGDSTWFLLTRNAADTAGVLSSAWGEATDATATFTIVYPCITFPSAVGEILRIKRFAEFELEFDHAGPVPASVGRPLTWGPYVHDSTSASPDDDKLRIFLNPAPEDRLVYSYWYKQRTTFLDPDGATTQTIPFSDLWYEAIVQGVLFHVWKQEAQSEKALLARGLYEDALSRARGSALPGAIIPPRRMRRSLTAWEERPIVDA